MTGSKTTISIIISVIVIVAAYFGYRLLFPPATTPSAPGLVMTTAAPGDASTAAGDEFLAILLSLRNLEFKTAVFDTLHQSQLRDFSTALSPQTPGRPNPFAPLGVGSRPATAATSTP